MTQRLIVVQHHPAEGIGEIGVWAERHGIALDVHRADLGALPPATDRPCVLLGGPHAVNDAPAWLQREAAWLRGRIAADVPVLGICLGAQLLAHALGGRVHPLDQPETGWTRIDFTDGSTLDALEWHEDSFTLPPGARSLASSEACPQQMFAHGTRRLGLQFHPEWNAALVDTLNAHFGDASPLPRQADAEKHERVARWFHRRLSEWWEA
ncbi:MAG: type 1 glutamine amidotransferase [Rhodanobacter sp.]|jgi:GMP synthase-like glutamine amidotransferase|nr:type 1 glutamine amidotransferase [Rhodanobacter sp.]